ncbi:unnamed protein product [Larinioides sclopetarius]|uniref:Thiamine transporter SLC35F3 n=1 Tax=Larinioides sclopetarius TaxID=280406 RepID=A0AAV1Z064_9ARAC
MSENIELACLPRINVDDLRSIDILVNADLAEDFPLICSLLGQDLQQRLSTIDEIIEAIQLKLKPHVEVIKKLNQRSEAADMDDNYRYAWLTCLKWHEKMEKLLKIKEKLQKLAEDPIALKCFTPIGDDPQVEHNDLNQLKSNHCCTGRARKTALGFLLTIIMCGTWIGMTHLLKWAYIIHLKLPSSCNCTSVNDSRSFITPSTTVLDMSSNRSTSKQVTTLPVEKEEALEPFRAPFLLTWFLTACNSLFFPIYLCTRFCSRRTRITARRSILEAMRRFRERGLSVIHFLTRSMFFCVLWVGTNYMLIYTIDKLDATVVMALQTSKASFVYLLSWVILHEQFVGIRIVAVILCNTGIALLAYMDGVARTSTLGGVVLAAAAAAGLSVHKVLFKKLIGRVTIGQLSLFLTLVGLLNILLLWPIGLTLYLVESEKIVWTQLPYVQLAGSGAFFIIGNILGNFDVAHDYDTYLKIGMISAVPVSAVLDVNIYNVVFEGMKLAGILLICIGFMLVLLPDNWPDYITRLIRWRCRRCPKTNKPTETSQPRARHIFARPS